MTPIEAKIVIILLLKFLKKHGIEVHLSGYEDGSACISIDVNGNLGTREWIEEYDLP